MAYVTAPKPATVSDEQIREADALSKRLSAASLEEIVECLTAWAMTLKRVVVDKEHPEADLFGVFREMLVDGAAAEETPAITDERRDIANRYWRGVRAMKPTDLVEIAQQMADAYRALLQTGSRDPLTELSRTITADIALAPSTEAQAAFSAYRNGTLKMRTVDNPRQLVTQLRAGTA